MGDPGGGSDFAGFYNHLGIPIADWGFGGPAGIYHSAYDSYHWMKKFGDPTFEFHAANARIGAAALLRIANAEILPYDYVEYARTMQRFSSQVERAIADKHWKLSGAVLNAAVAKNGKRRRGLQRGAGSRARGPAVTDDREAGELDASRS